MPFSAATGLAEAASATEARSSDQRLASRMQAAANLPGRTPSGVLDSPLEIGNDMKVLSPFRRGLASL
jgi:hypothetical protein